MEQNKTAPYNLQLNVFNPQLQEVFEIIKTGTPRLLKQLLVFHTNVSLESHYYQKYTPLMEAAYLGHKDMVSFICKTVKEKYTKNGYISFQYEQYLNQVSMDGKSAIMIATLNNNNTDVIRYLVEEGADIHITDRFNKTVFDYALISPTDSIEEYILSLKK